MNLSENTQAILLLTSYFSKPNNNSEKPLGNAEWGRFALWLKETGSTPADLLTTNSSVVLQRWQDRKITKERLENLLQRGHSLALAMEKWQRAGLWVMTRSDSDYPRRLKARLKNNAPAALFGCGNKEILNTGGVAVVGSRNVGEEDLAFARQLGDKAANNAVGIVSGAARGVDEAAMLAAMNAGGSVIGVIANGLLQAATSVKWRQGLMEGHVVLVSTFYPESGFNVGNAMARNKYIYCLADATVVVHSGKKGGTLSGAEENLKNNWTPLWIKPTEDKLAANSELVEKGGFWCTADVDQLDLGRLIQPQSRKINHPPQSSQQADLFSNAVREPATDFCAEKPDESGVSIHQGHSKKQGRSS